MKSKQLVEEFESTWAYTRNMTDVFIDCVPDEKWHYSHHPKFGPLSKQFRHMVCVYGCYINAFKTQVMDLSQKKLNFSDELTRENIKAALKTKDQELKVVLDSLKEKKLDEYSINFFGQQMGFTEYCDVLIQHESAHFGIWANYAAFGEFETPEMWKRDWEL